MQFYIDRLEREYDADCDVPDGPQVTWADADLLEICKWLLGRIETLEKQVEDLNIVQRRNLSE